MGDSRMIDVMGNDNQIWVSHSLIAIKDYEAELTSGRRETRKKLHVLLKV